MKNLEKLTNIIESILFVSGAQVAISDIAEKLEISEKDVMSIAQSLKTKYSKDSGIQLLIFNRVSSTVNPNYKAPCQKGPPYLNSEDEYPGHRRRYARRKPLEPYL